ncbi:MAG: universal stress protein [Rubricoccaceae bacterium]|nr:universal stress protein [Rubricoccaceae bacterium]
MFTCDRLLVPIDFSGASDAALRRALDLARRTGAEVHLLHVVPGFAALGPEEDFDALPEAEQAFFRHVWGQAQAQLDARLALARPEGLALRKVLSYGLPSAVALEYAEENDVDLIVMGTHGRRGVRRLVLGSVAEEVMRRADVPVMVVPEGSGAGPFLYALAPTDFSRASRLVLPVAAAVADLYGARISLLHAVEPIPLLAAVAGFGTVADLLPDLLPRAEDELERVAADPALARADAHVLDGRAAEAITGFAEDHGVDLIVMAKHGLHGVDRLLLGSVTERVARTAPCTVLALPVDEATDGA